MPRTRRRILFVSHSASLNGASILLVGLLRWLKEQVDWDIETLVHGRGPLLEDFRALGKTTVWRDPRPALNALMPSSWATLRRGLASMHAGLSLPNGRYDLIYANTSASAPLVRLVRGRASTLLWHVHELDYALRLTLPQAEALELFRSASRYVAVSNAVRSTLINNHGIPADRIDLVNGFVTTQAGTESDREAKRRKLRKDLSIPPDAFVVGACGSLGWRKGSDIFLQVARHIMSAATVRAVRFLWVGGKPADPETLAFEHDLQLLGLTEVCRLVPTTSDVLDYYNVMDVFALTSREDPFPLVVLEAAERGLPVVCFDRAGGANEFIADGCGCAVPYLDVEAFSSAVMRLRQDPEAARQLGREGQRQVRESYCVESQGPKLLRSMQLALSDSTSPAADGRVDSPREAASEPKVESEGVSSSPSTLR